MAGQPETVSDQITERLNALIGETSPHNELKLAALRRDILELQATNPIDYHMFSGCIASLQSNFEELERHFGIAMNMSGNSPDVIDYYMVGLVNNNGFRKAADLFLNFYNSVNDRQSTIDMGLKALFQSGLISEGVKHSQLYNQQFKEHHWLESAFNDLSKSLEGCGIVQSDLEKIYAMIWESADISHFSKGPALFEIQCGDGEIDIIVLSDASIAGLVSLQRDLDREYSKLVVSDSARLKIAVIVESADDEVVRQAGC